MCKSRKKLMTLIIISIMLIAIPVTYSFYQSSVNVPNTFETKVLGLGIDEEFVHGQDILPGEQTEKKVKFINVEDTDLLLRVKVSENWYLGNEIKKDADVNKMIKNWASTWPAETSETADWKKMGDYYYYKHVFKGNTQTDLILESLQLSPDVSNDDHDIDYSNLAYKLKFDAEGSRVNDLQVEKLFGNDITFQINGDHVNWTQSFLN